ncbi:hypothetical protein ACFWJ4_28445 [Kitasatospora sp. NPDC127067]
MTTPCEWSFSECHVSGPRAWQGVDTTSAIARAIADLLEKGSDS